MNDKLKISQNKDDSNTLNLVQEVITRWNATYLMIERLLVLKNNVNMVLQETHTNQNKHKKLLINDNDTEWYFRNLIKNIERLNKLNSQK